MNKKIKQYLKEIGFMQKDLAESLRISRPTLDSYIQMYELNQRIPRERYDITFHRLFDEELSSKEEFEYELQEIVKLFEQDERLGIENISPDAADMFTSVLNNMKEDMSQGEWNEDIYIFVNTIISGYKKQENKRIFNYLAKYFLALNGILEIEAIEDEQKPYMAKLYSCMFELTQEKVEMDNYFYNKFVKRCKDIMDEKNERKKKQEEEIRIKISEVIDDFRIKGIEPTNENIYNALIMKN